MKKYIFIFVMVFIFTGCKTKNVETKTEDKKEVQVVLLAGQSNMQGAGDFDQLDPSEIKRIEKISSRVSLSFNGGKAKPLSYYDNKPSEKYEFTKRFGPEIFIGLTLAENNPDQEFLLIKCSQGGTALYGAWNPNWTAEKAKAVEKPKKQNIKLYNMHIQDVRANLKALETQNKTYKIIGLAWMQGENDAAKEISATTYEANLKLLAQSYRDEFGVENMPFVIGQINSRYGKFKKLGPAMVRKAMEDVVNLDANADIIKTTTDANWSDYPKHTDNVHYNAEGQRRLGIAFGEKLIILNK
ncbi:MULTISPECIES: sialate O-acetylesterase [Lacinutrix]|uniref:sialate O-acetylesterase n=1 Tax=Lacinutrix TaxID=291183 RepID=UPI0006E349C4|nr:MULTISPECIES: sialate O-acetylesterase [Lacinutrix]QRM89491.1 sialate O-acetylesterase [Lacinutrix sp. WUR7]